jgi:hypothetical protein
MITLSRRARTKQYARGNENPIDRITSAMQMVALRETPTRQWTSVAVLFALPLSGNAISSGSGVVWKHAEQQGRAYR